MILALGTSQNATSNIFEKKFKFLGFHAVATCKDLSIDVSITNVKQIFSRGMDSQTDMELK